MENTKETRFTRHRRANALQRLSACTGPAQLQIGCDSNNERGNGSKPHPSSRSSRQLTYNQRKNLFSPKESYRGYKPPLEKGPNPSSRFQHKMNSVGFLKYFFSHNALFVISVVCFCSLFYLSDLLHIYFSIFVFMRLLCAKLCLPVPAYFHCALFFVSFSCLFVLSFSHLFCFSFLFVF